MNIQPGFDSADYSVGMEVWYGWNNGKIVRQFSNRWQADDALERNVVDSISPVYTGD